MMTYEKFKAEVQEHFPTVWEFTDESDLSFNRTGAGGCGGGYHKKYQAINDQVLVVWDGDAEYPVLFIVKGFRTVRYRRRTIAECAHVLRERQAR